MSQRRGGCKHTTNQVEYPDIIEIHPVDLATKDDELRTDQRHSMVVSATWAGAIEHDAIPLS